MGVHDYEDLAQHVGHQLECVRYGSGQNVAVECLDCCCVLVDFDHPDLRPAENEIPPEHG